MHLSQVASGSPPSQHSQEGQHTGQEGDRRIAEQGAREGQHHTGQACCGPRRDETTPQRLDIALKNLGLDELGEDQAGPGRHQGRPRHGGDPATSGRHRREHARRGSHGGRDEVLHASHRHQQTAPAPGHGQPPGGLVGTQEEWAEPPK